MRFRPVAPFPAVGVGQDAALRLAAQYFFMRSEWAFLAAADMPLRCRRGLISGMGFAASDFGGRPRRFGIAGAEAIALEFLGGLPRRLTGP
jgi:hypothetical protein